MNFFTTALSGFAFELAYVVVLVFTIDFLIVCLS